LTTFSPSLSKFSRTFMTMLSPIAAAPSAAWIVIRWVTPTPAPKEVPDCGSNLSFICLGTAACTRNELSDLDGAASYRAVNPTMTLDFCKSST